MMCGVCGMIERGVWVRVHGGLVSAFCLFGLAVLWNVGAGLMPSPCVDSSWLEISNFYCGFLFRAGMGCSEGESCGSFLSGSCSDFAAGLCYLKCV